MKLTHEGAARLGCHESRGFPVGDFEFRPEDFDGCFQDGKGHVVLTVEEAKTIEFCFAIFQKHFKLFEPELNLWQELRKRIGQAEMSKQSTSEG